MGFNDPVAGAKVGLYAPNGSIATPNPIQLNDAGVYAPTGTITFTGGGNVQTGFMESQFIVLNNGGQQFNGSGPGSGPTTTTITTTSTSTFTTSATTTIPGYTDPGSTTTVVTGTTLDLNQ